MKREARSPIGFSVILAMLARSLRLLLPVIFAFAVQGQAPRLDVSSSPLGNSIQVHLSGETNRAYLVEISTNLMSWRLLAELHTTNGAAMLSYDSTGTHHSFLRARTEQPVLTLTPQVAPVFDVKAFFSTDGGELGLVTPDLRSITLSIPPGCLTKPTEVRLSLVTNLIGLPFAQGTIGTVEMRPEGLVLMGAATLSIEFPRGLDHRRVISFAASNDGTGFNLTPDRVHTNRAIIPISDFAMYGTAIATLEEVQSFSTNPDQLSAQNADNPLRWPPLSPHELEVCRQTRRDLFTSDVGQFPPSTRQCFAPLVTRAIEVQHAIRAYLECRIKPDIAYVLGRERQQQLLDADPMSEEELASFYGQIARDICPIYQQIIEPYWVEAQENCALSLVLMQTMLGFERQIQLLGATNLANCNYTLSRNLDKVCKAAEECIREVKLCCIQGHRGQEKYLEIQNILRQVAAIGETNCFALQMEDPRVQEALDVCLTNSWFGSLNVRHYGRFTKTTTSGNTETYQTAEIDLKFDGSIFASDEDPAAPELGKSIGLRVMGTGTAKLENTFTTITRHRCLDGSTVESRSYTRDLNSGSFTGTNDVNVIWGEYDLGIHIHADNQFYTIGSAGPLLFTEVTDQHYSSFASCEGSSTSESPPPTTSVSGVGFPMLPPLTKPMGANTNILEATYQVVDGSGEFPVTSTFIWNFRRVDRR